MRKYTDKLGLLLIAMIIDLILMYGWSEGGVSHANRNCTSDFARMSLHIFIWLRSGVIMKHNLLMKCTYLCFYVIYLRQHSISEQIRCEIDFQKHKINWCKINWQTYNYVVINSIKQLNSRINLLKSWIWFFYTYVTQLVQYIPIQ
jgi:hypothetical protein